MEKFNKIKGEANKMGLSSKTIKKVLALVKYAEANGVTLYLDRDKLRMQDRTEFSHPEETFADRSEKRFYAYSRKFFNLK